MKPLRFLSLYFFAIGIVRLIIGLVILTREDKQE